MAPIFEAEVFLTDYENNTLTPYNQIILYSRWFIDQARTLENSPNALSYPSTLFNVLMEVQNGICKKTPLYKQYEDILDAIYHFRQNQDPQNLNSRFYRISERTLLQNIYFIIYFFCFRTRSRVLPTTCGTTTACSSSGRSR